MVVVRDAYASNEDRIEVVDLNGPVALRYVIEHVDWDACDHASVEPVDDQSGRLLLTESQHAGAGIPPRSRTISLGQRPGFEGVAAGRWAYGSE